MIPDDEGPVPDWTNEYEAWCAEQDLDDAREMARIQHELTDDGQVEVSEREDQ